MALLLPAIGYNHAVRHFLADVSGQALRSAKIEPDEVASLVCELYRNEALTADVYYIHGGLRLGSKG